MEKLSDRIKDFPTEQFIDWLCLSCVDVRASHSDELAQEDINEIREAVTVRLAALEDKLRIKQNHIRLRDSYIEELEECAEAAEEKVAQRDALAAKGMELCREAARVYEKYNVTQMPDMDLVDCQTIQEFSDLAGGSINTDAYANQLRAEGVEMFAKQTRAIGEQERCAEIIYAAVNAETFAANLRKENGND